MRPLDVPALGRHDIDAAQRHAEPPVAAAVCERREGVPPCEQLEDARAQLVQEGLRFREGVSSRVLRTRGERHDAEREVQPARGDDDGFVEPGDSGSALEERTCECGHASAQVCVVALGRWGQHLSLSCNKLVGGTYDWQGQN